AETGLFPDLKRSHPNQGRQNVQTRAARGSWCSRARANLMDAGWRPLDGPVMFVHDERPRFSWQGLQCLEELDNRRLVIRTQIREGALPLLRLPGMRQDGFPNRSELPVMKMVRAGPYTPQPLGEEIPVACKKCRRSGRLILVDRFYVGVARSA